MNSLVTLMRVYGRCVLAMMLVVALASCASIPLNPQGEPRKGEKRLVVEDLQAPTVAAEETDNTNQQEPSQATLSPVLDTQQEKPELELWQQPGQQEPTFDIAADDVPAGAFYMSLVEGTDLNMVVHPDVTGDITVQLKQVTLKEALDVVRDIYGLDYLVKSYGYQIVPRELKSKLFRVNYLNVSRIGKSSMQVNSGQVSMSEDGESSDDDEESSSEGGGSNQSTQVNTESETGFWNKLDYIIKTIVGVDDGRKIVVDPESGIVVVKAYPAELKSVEEFLDRAELSLKKQVVIEAKIMEVVLSEGYQAGIQWDTFGLGYNGEIQNSDKRVVGKLTPDTFTTLIDNTVEGFFTLGLNNKNFNAVINLLEAHGDVNVLSSPRISTVNNQKAVIKVGTDEYFVTDISNETTSSSTTTSQSPEVSLTPFFSGIALDVTPHIGEDDEVVLHVHPTITEVEERVKDIGIGEAIISLPLAFSTIRETDSIIKAKDGQVVVIGGLMQEKVTSNSAGVPYISNVPYLGEIFKQRRDLTVKTELVILLKPKVISSEEWVDEEALIKQRFPQFYTDEL